MTTTSDPSAITVLSIGQCRIDHAAISHYLSAHFKASVVSADRPDDALQVLASQPVSLVLINRKLDADGSDGLDLIPQIRQAAALSDVPIMLVSNYEEWQDKAISLGALRGFGKAELNRPQTRETLSAVLSPRPATAK